MNDDSTFHKVKYKTLVSPRYLNVLTARFLIDNVPSVKLLPFAVFLTIGVSGLHGSLGQSTGATEWPTGSFDQQRDGWQRNENKFTVDNVKTPPLVWEAKDQQQAERYAIVSRADHRGGRIHTQRGENRCRPGGQLRRCV